MSSYVISSGVSSGYALKSGDTLVVNSGGDSDGSTVSSGGRETVLSGGLSENDTVLSGGLLTLSSAATAESLTVSAAGVVHAAGALLSGSITVAGQLVSGSVGGAFDVYGDPTASGDLLVVAGGLVQDITLGYGQMEIEAGGSALSTTLVSNFFDTYATLIVDNGGVANGTQIGANQQMYDYGLTSGTVLSGGTDYVFGSAVAEVVSAQGLQVAENGGVASKTEVMSGGIFELGAGGVAKSVLVKSGGEAELSITVSSGQTFQERGGQIPLSATLVISGITVDSGAYLDALETVVDSGGVVVQGSGVSGSSFRIEAGGELSGGIIIDGEYSSDANTDAGLVIGVTLVEEYQEEGLLQVLSGGEAETITLSAYTKLDVQSGGVGSAVVVSGVGSLLLIESGGYVHGATIGGVSAYTGQSANVFGSSVDDVIKFGGFEVVQAGGQADRTTVSSGGEQIVLSGGDAIDTVVRAGGEIILSPGGSVTGGVVSSGGLAVITVDVASGQTYDLAASVPSASETVDGLTISSGGMVEITGATVESGGILHLQGNVLGDGVTVSSGGRLSGAGTLLGDTVDQGLILSATLGDAAGDPARLDVGSGGVVSVVSVLNGDLTVDSGGKAARLTISSGGEADIASGGSAIVVQVDAGGALGVVSGAAVTSVTVSSGATLTVSQGVVAAGSTAVVGTVAASTISAGAAVLSGGAIDRDDLTVSSGGVLDLGAGGVADSVDIIAGGVVSGAGLLTGENLNAGTVSGVTLAGYMIDAGRLHGADLASGASVLVQGVAASDVVSSGATVTVESGGVASTMVLLSGARQIVLSGGDSESTTISSGASQYVSSGGMDSGTVVKAGGFDTLAYGAVASNIVVSSGGTLTLEEAIVSAGQTLVLTSGGAASLDGVSVLAGATLDIDVTFVRSGATLSLAAGASYGVDVESGGKLIGPGDISEAPTPYGLISQETGQFTDYGLISGATIGFDGAAQLQVGPGGAVDNVTDYGILEVLSGGTGSGVTVVGYFSEAVGDVVSNLVVKSTALASFGGSIVGLTDSGGLVVDAGQATSVSISSGELWVSGSQSEASGVSIGSGGALMLDLAASVTSATVSSGGGLILDEDGATLQSGKTLSVGVLAATTTVDGVVVSKGAYEDAAFLNVASGATVTFGSGGALGYVDIEAGAVVKGPGVIFGGSEIYGAVSGVTAGFDPQYSPYSGIETTYPLLQLGSQMIIESAGSAVSMTVASGGIVYTAIGGKVTDYVVEAGGSMAVDGSAISGQVQSGGTLVLQAGTLTAATVSSGGAFVDAAAFTVSAGLTAVQGAQTAAVTVGGARISSGATIDYNQVTVLSGGVFRLSASTLAETDFYDTIMVSAGGVVSGTGAYFGSINDFGLVSGIVLGNAEPGAKAGLLSVSSGGAASAVTILSGASLNVAAGGRVVGAVIDGATSGATDYGREVVYSGGVASGGKVLSNGSAFFASGAVAKGVVIEAGGAVTLGFGVSAGQTISVATSALAATTTLDGVTMDAGARLTLDGIGVSSGGRLLLGANAVAEGLTISRGGVVSGGILAEIDSGSSVDNGLLEDAQLGGARIPSFYVGLDQDIGETLTIGSGGVGSNLNLVQGSITIDSGGFVKDVRVQAGLYAELQVNVGGVLEDATLEASQGVGQLQNYVYGSATGDTIGGGGVENVQTGGADIGALIQSGGSLVQDGGFINDATVLSGGTFYAGEDGQTESVVISSGGHIESEYYADITSGQTVVDGAVTSTTVISGATLLKGAITDYGAEVDSGGVFSVGAGGEAQSVYVYGGLVSGTGSLLQGGQNSGVIDKVTLLGFLYDAGVTSAVTIGSGGADIMGSGATARADIVGSGGEQIISSGAAASLEQVLSGGQILVSVGGVATSITVSSGGSATVQTVVSSGVTQTFAAPGASTAATFGGLKLEAGATGTLQTATVLSGGRLVLDAGAVVEGGGYYISSYGENFPATAGVTVESGGSISGAGSIAGLLVLSSGAVASGVSIVSGGVDQADSGARQSAVKIQSGGELQEIGLAITGAVVAGTVSGTETVAGVTISSGGELTVSGGSVAKSASLQVLSGGLVDDITTVAGGTLTDNGEVLFDQTSAFKLGGTLSGAGIISVTGSATTLVLSGAASHFTGETIIKGSALYDYQTGVVTPVADVVEVATSGGLGTGAVVFGGSAVSEISATLQIDAADTPATGATFANALNGFVDSDDYLDLRGLAFTSGAKATVSGSVLTLTDGSRTEKFVLTGATTSAFTVTSDGHGGTLISPTAVKTQAVLAQADAVQSSTAPSAAGTTASAASATVGSGTVEHSAAVTANPTSVTTSGFGASGLTGGGIVAGRPGASFELMEMFGGGRAQLLDPAVAAFAQAAAAFGSTDAATAIPASATTSNGLASLLHATGSGGAAHV